MNVLVIIPVFILGLLISGCSLKASLESLSEKSSPSPVKSSKSSGAEFISASSQSANTANGSYRVQSSLGGIGGKAMVHSVGTYKVEVNIQSSLLKE